MPESARNLSSRLTIQLNAFFVIWRTRSILICNAFIITPLTPEGYWLMAEKPQKVGRTKTGVLTQRSGAGYTTHNAPAA